MSNLKKIALATGGKVVEAKTVPVTEKRALAQLLKKIGFDEYTTDFAMRTFVPRELLGLGEEDEEDFEFFATVNLTAIDVRIVSIHPVRGRVSKKISYAVALKSVTFFKSFKSWADEYVATLKSIKPAPKLK